MFPISLVPEVFLHFSSFREAADTRCNVAKHSMTCREKIQGGFSGEDFNDATSSRFDGGDSAFSKNATT